MEVNIIKMFKLILGRIYKSHSLNANIDNANFKLFRKNTFGKNTYYKLRLKSILSISEVSISVSTPTSTSVFLLSFCVILV